MDEFETKIKLKGIVNDITYRNDANGYTVFAVDTGEEELTVVGTTPDLKLGDKVELVGEYTYHSVYGRQFKAEFCNALLPETVEDLYHYLASGVIKGITPFCVPIRTRWPNRARLSIPPMVSKRRKPFSPMPVIIKPTSSM